MLQPEIIDRFQCVAHRFQSRQAAIQYFAFFRCNLWEGHLDFLFDGAPQRLNEFRRRVRVVQLNDKVRPSLFAVARLQFALLNGCLEGVVGLRQINVTRWITTFEWCLQRGHEFLFQTRRRIVDHRADTIDGMGFY